MPIEIEKVNSIGLSTDIAPDALELNSGQRMVVNPIVDCLNKRYIIGDNGKWRKIQSVSGNTMLSVPYTSNAGGKVIGKHNDYINNRIIYFVCTNNNSLHIYYINTKTNVITRVLGLSDNNSADIRSVVSCYVLGDYLIWAQVLNASLVGVSLDGYNKKEIYTLNLTRSEQINNSIYTSGNATLLKKPPLATPTVSIPIKSDTYSKYRNELVGKSFQFTYRYVYLDNEVSVLSPISDIVRGSINPYLIGDKIPISITINEYGIKSIQVLVRENNSSDWYIFKIIYDIPNEEHTYSFYFSNNETKILIPQSESSKIFESIPTISNTLAIQKNRVFLSSNIESFDVSKETIRLNITYYPYQNINDETDNSFLKVNGKYKIGIILFDSLMRSMGVVNPININMNSTNNIGINIIYDPIINNNIKYYSIGITDEYYYQIYNQFYGYIGLCVNEDSTKVINIPEGQRYQEGHIFVTRGRLYNSGVGATGYKKIYIRVNLNMAFIPDSDCYVRFIGLQKDITSDLQLPICKVVSFDGQYIVLDQNLSVSNALEDYIKTLNPNINSNTQALFPSYFEIFKINNKDPSIYYEVPRTRKSIDVQIPTYDLKLHDTYIFKKTVSMSVDVSEDMRSTDIRVENYIEYLLESPTPVGIITEEKRVNEAFSYQYCITLDYQNIASNKGFPFVELINKQQIINNSLLRYSNTISHGANINGLGRFDAGDQHTISLDRGKIVKLVPLSNNILCVHERQTTTIYTEEGLLRNADDSSNLIKTKDVIGHDRSLYGHFGSIHYNSIANIDSLVFAFDASRGCVWQYSQDGQTSISDFDMRSFFNKIKKDYDNSLISDVIGEIDSYYYEYIISFHYIDTTKSITIGYNYKENKWTSRYSFIPTMMASTYLSLYSFNNNAPYLHNSNKDFTIFYGTIYESFIKIAVNPFPSKNKAWLGIQIRINTSGWQMLNRYGDSYKLVEFETDTPSDAYGLGAGKSIVYGGNTITGLNQNTYLYVEDFDSLEGVIYGNILKDVNTPSNEVGNKIKRFYGNDMRGRYLIVKINDKSHVTSEIQQINITYLPSEYST